MDPSASDLQRYDGDLPLEARLDFAPPRADDRGHRGNWVRRAAAVVGVSSILHAAFLAGFVVVVTWSERTLDTGREIPVEVVARVPGEETRPPPPRMPGATEPKAAAGSQLLPPAPPAAPGTTETPPVTPQPPPVAAAASPPPAVAPPPDAAPAATQPDKPVVANTEPDRPTTEPVRSEPTPAEAPEVLATRDTHAFVVPRHADPSPEPPPPHPRASAATLRPDPGAVLAAALPRNIDALPPNFRAVFAGAGAELSPQYKGLVFGRLGRSHEIMERARAQHLRGQAVVAFSIDDSGAIADLSIVQSSGNATLDGLALELVRAAGPFPPPPPGAQRNFTPALTFGD